MENYNMKECYKKTKLQWLNHPKRMEESSWPNKYQKFMVGGTLAREEPIYIDWSNLKNFKKFFKLTQRGLEE